ncbi:type III secretion system chaperone [Acanthopleuribacter pedis]|uniref:Type III secretion system chaperone n=1 Tax=Acanthopleuribacter pedis TaxID=442870 RepID=A0A8J7U5C6_9BACT|nr:type III secretion system chaperone [Acanthopleuribacter pedis]MBO1320714.1 type III secretion system chaperone [Acanthopleuribacter pedis]
MEASTLAPPCDNLPQLLDAFCRHFRLNPIPVKDRNRACLIFDNRLAVTIAERPGRRDIILFCDVATVPTDRPEITALLLAANEGTVPMDGPDRVPVFPAAFALNPDTGSIVLRDQRPLATLTALRFSDWLDAFVSLATCWQDAVTADVPTRQDTALEAPRPSEPAEPRPQAATPAAQLPRNNWRRC